MTRSELIGQRIAKLTGAFEHYVQAYDERVPFTSEQLAAHRACIALRKQAGNVRAAVGDESFVRALHATLRAFLALPGAVGAPPRAGRRQFPPLAHDHRPWPEPMRLAISSSIWPSRNGIAP
jgi:hypothetical protein